MLAVDDLHPNPDNARKHSARQLKLLAKSIKTYGFVFPLLTDENNVIIAGHARFLAAQQSGASSIPTICVHHLDEAQKQALALADNRLTDLSTWDEQLLADQLRCLSALRLDFDLEATGFELAEIDLRIQAINIDATDGGSAVDELPLLPLEHPVSKFADLWQLGRHRLLVGSAVDASAFSRLMEGELASAVLTDPPYNVPVDGHVSGLGIQHHREFAMGSGEMSDDAFQKFLSQTMKLLARHSADGSLHYIFMDWRHLPEVLAAGAETYTELKNLCVWAKHNAGMGSFYRSQHELVLVYKHGRAAHRNNIQLGRFGRSRSNV
jgi:ParB-like nuclease domain/DNA methylase